MKGVNRFLKFVQSFGWCTYSQKYDEKKPSKTTWYQIKSLVILLDDCFLSLPKLKGFLSINLYFSGFFCLCQISCTGQSYICFVLAWAISSFTGWGRGQFCNCFCSYGCKYGDSPVLQAWFWGKWINGESDPISEPGE